MSITCNVLVNKCRELLERTWIEVKKDNEAGQVNYIEDEEIITAIHQSINSKTKSYRYVLPTQILSKSVESNLDAICLQVERGGSGAFDARSVAHQVIVDFDRANHKVLGGSPEPYVNNPLRYPEVSDNYRSKQRDKDGWDNLCKVLNSVQAKSDPGYTKLVLKQILKEVLLRLESVNVIYPVPARISLNKTISVIKEYTSMPSGGDRVQAITTALVIAIGNKFNLFKEVKRGSINASDASTGMVSDIECFDINGNLVLAIEIKDIELTLAHIQVKLPNFRAKQVTEILFIINKGIVISDKEAITATIDKEFSSGQNIYVFDLIDFSTSSLAILGEKGRRGFLEEVGKVLDEFNSNLIHKQDWAKLLSEI